MTAGFITERLTGTTDQYEGIYSIEDFENQVKRIYRAFKNPKTRILRLDEVATLYRMFEAFSRTFPETPIKADDDLVTYVCGKLDALEERENLTNNTFRRPDQFDPGKSPEENVRANLEPEQPGTQIPNKEAMAIYNLYYRNIIEQNRCREIIADNGERRTEGAIPDKRRLSYIVRKTILDHYKDYPTPEEKMTQIVDALTDPAVNPVFEKDEWKGDSTRLRILKQFIKYGGGFRYYNLKTEESVDEKTGKTIYRRKEETVNIVTGRAMIEKYVYDRLPPDDPLRKKRKKNIPLQDLVDHLHEDVFEPYDRKRKEAESDSLAENLRKAAKDSYKPNGKYEILRAADELAGGRGRFSEETRRYVYLFALVYGMTYEHDVRGTGKITDVSTLFRRFYMDEPGRYLLHDIPGRRDAFIDEPDRRSSHSDKDKRHGNGRDDVPSGQGINRKNVVDVIYLYFLHKPLSSVPSSVDSEDVKQNVPDEGAGELRQRVFNADRMIRRVTGDGNGKDNPRMGAPGETAGDTMHYNDLVRRLLGEDETVFESTIREKYDCGVTIKTGDRAQNTAYQLYQLYIVALYKLTSENPFYPGRRGAEWFRNAGEELLKLRNRNDGGALLSKRFQEIYSGESDNRKGSAGKASRGSAAVPDSYMELDIFHYAEGEENGMDERRQFLQQGYSPKDLDLAEKVIRKADDMLKAQTIRKKNKDTTKEDGVSGASQETTVRRECLVCRAEDMTRNILLGAYFACYKEMRRCYLEYYPALKEMDPDMESPYIEGGFADVYRDFREKDYGDGILLGADNILDEAWYQTMDMRNLLDMLVVFSIYLDQYNT